MSDSSLGPSRWYYALAAFIVVAGIALFISTLMSGLGSLGNDLQQVVVPGSSDIMLSEVGEYTIFYENQTVVNGRIYSTDEDIPGLQIEVKNKTTGLEIATYQPSGSFSYSIGGRSGRSVLAFDVEQPGIYVISGAYPEGQEGTAGHNGSDGAARAARAAGSVGPEAVLAVGHGITGSIISGVLYPLIIFFGSIAAAAVIAILTYLKRQEAAKRAEEDERMIRGEG
jgi:hypothetical protein